MGVVYKILCNKTDEVYVGSTITSFNKRMIAHRFFLKKYDNGENVSYCSAYDILRRGDYSTEILEELDTPDKRELHKCETKWIKELNSINKMKKAYATPEEKRETAKLRFATEEYKKKKAQWDKKYCENNKEKILEQKREYHKQNKEKISEKKKEYREKNKEYIKQQKKKDYEKKKEQGKSDSIECPCGGTYSYCSKARHFKTKKHQNYINENN